MNKRKLPKVVTLLSKAVAMLTSIALVSAILTSCTSTKELEENLRSYQTMYQEQILDHFAQNEDTFIRIVKTFDAILEEADNLEDYYNVTLVNDVIYSDDKKSVRNNYVMTVSKYVMKDGERVKTGEQIDLLTDARYNRFDLTEAEFNRVFISEEDYKHNEEFGTTYVWSPELIKYTYVSFKYILANDSAKGNFIHFDFYIERPVGKKPDRANMVLIYSRSGEAPQSTGGIKLMHQINDHWYLDYQLYLSPAI